MKILMFLILLILAALGALWWLNGQSTQSNSPARGQKTQPQAGQQAARRQVPAQPGQGPTTSGMRQKAPQKNAFEQLAEKNTGGGAFRVHQYGRRKLDQQQAKQKKRLENALK